MNEEQMKIVADFLQGKFESSDPIAKFLRKRHLKRMEDLKAVQERHKQAMEMLTKLEKQGLALEGALQECVEQLAEVLSNSDPKDQKEQNPCVSTELES